MQAAEVTAARTPGAECSEKPGQARAALDHITRLEAVLTGPMAAAFAAPFAAMAAEVASESHPSMPA